MAGNHGRSATMVDIGGALAATRVQRQALGSRSHVIPEGSLVPAAMRGYTHSLLYRLTRRLVPSIIINYVLTEPRSILFSPLDSHPILTPWESYNYTLVYSSEVGFLRVFVKNSLLEDNSAVHAPRHLQCFSDCRLFPSTRGFRSARECYTVY